LLFEDVKATIESPKGKGVVEKAIK